MSPVKLKMVPILLMPWLALTVLIGHPFVLAADSGEKGTTDSNTVLISTMHGGYGRDCPRPGPLWC